MQISVVVTTYERADALKKCLWSLNSQVRPPEEVVVSDDGSRADILASLRTYADVLDFHLVYVRQEDKGFRLAKCRNNGVRVSTGDYLVFLDQDIVVTPGYINLFAECARPHEFLVAYPVLLTEGQSGGLSLDHIARGDYRSIVSDEQLLKIRRQYSKDRFYTFLRNVFGHGSRPKVRGGAFGMFKDDLLHVDGFDENYVGWGTEDDDLGRRLYRTGVTGRTVFLHDFPLHLWHVHSTGGEDSINIPYYNRRLRQIAAGDFKAVNGLSDPLGDDFPQVVRIK